MMETRASLKFHSTAAFVRDIAVSKRFYTEVLGLAVELDFGKNVILEGGITLWEIISGHIIPRQLGVDSIADRAVNRFEFYFEAEDIEAVAEQVAAGGVEFLHAIHEEPWGQRTMRFFDPDRHLIEVGEPLEVFVRRLYRGGMTPAQVSRKTSIPLETVTALIGHAGD